MRVSRAVFISIAFQIWTMLFGIASKCCFPVLLVIVIGARGLFGIVIALSMYRKQQWVQVGPSGTGGAQRLQEGLLIFCSTGINILYN